MRQSKVQCSDVEWGGEKYNGRGYAVTVTLECLCWDLLPSKLIMMVSLPVMMSVWRRKGVSKNVSLSATRCHLLSARNSILYQLQPTAQWTLHSGQVDTGAEQQLVDEEGANADFCLSHRSTVWGEVHFLHPSILYITSDSMTHATFIRSQTA